MRPRLLFAVGERENELVESLARGHFPLIERFTVMSAGIEAEFFRAKTPVILDTVKLFLIYRSVVSTKKPLIFAMELIFNHFLFPP